MWPRRMLTLVCLSTFMAQHSKLKHGGPVIPLSFTSFGVYAMTWGRFLWPFPFFLTVSLTALPLAIFILQVPVVTSLF